MNSHHEWFPIHENSEIAGAVGVLLADASTIEEVARQFDVTPSVVAEVIAELGITDHIEAPLPERTEPSEVRSPPQFLVDRPPVSRPQDGIRDEKTEEIVGNTYSIPFVQALLSDASQQAREEVEQHVQETFGCEADGITVVVEGRPTAHDFPDHIRWIGVHYPVGTSETTPPTNVKRPVISFERLKTTLPTTTDVTVKLEGETFTIRNIPVTAARMQRI